MFEWTKQSPDLNPFQRKIYIDGCPPSSLTGLKIFYNKDLVILFNLMYKAG